MLSKFPSFGKLSWLFRGLCYSLIYKEMRLSIFGKPIFTTGLSRMRTGSKLRIYPGARIEIYSGAVAVGQNVSIGQCFHLICADSVQIGDDVVIGPRVTVNEVEHRYDATGSRLDTGWVVRPIKIGKGVFLGANSVVLGGCSIGDYAVIGANSVVNRDVPDNATFVGGKIFLKD